MAAAITIALTTTAARTSLRPARASVLRATPASALRAARTSALRAARVSKRSLKRGEFFELFKPGIDLLASQRAEPFHAEPLATETAHHRPVDHRAPQLVRIHIFGFQ